MVYLVSSSSYFDEETVESRKVFKTLEEAQTYKEEEVERFKDMMDEGGLEYCGDCKVEGGVDLYAQTFRGQQVRYCTIKIEKVDGEI